ncbi:MAG: O-methyltransferase [bacterium]
MSKIKLLIKYLVYRFCRKGTRGHGLHSPFVYKFNRDVLNDRIQYPEYLEIKEFRRSLMNRNERIQTRDHGARSKIFSSEHRKIKDILKYSGTSYRMGKLLFRLARYMHPKTVVELGTSLGFGTFCLSRGTEQGMVYTLEACPSLIKMASYLHDKTGAGNIEILEGDIGNTLPQLLDQLERVDLVYFDGDHRKEALLWQFRQCLPKAVPGTVFIIDDINWSPGMNEAWKMICREPSVSLSIDLFEFGLLIFRQGMAKQHFKLSYSG